MPLEHPPGHAQVDFGEAIGIIGGEERKIHFFAMDLSHSDACFVAAYPAETTEAFCDGHVRAFSFFGGVPRSILYDNTKIAVARILGDGERQRTRVFSELQSHYLFEDRFRSAWQGQRQGQGRRPCRLRPAQLPGAAPGVRKFRRPQCPSSGLLPKAHGRPAAWPRRDHRRAACA